jgi:hypothetical protein
MEDAPMIANTTFITINVFRSDQKDSGVLKIMNVYLALMDVKTAISTIMQEKK